MPVFNYFISYAHRDHDLVVSLLDLLRPRFKILSDFELRPWRDDMIVLGAQWRAQIEAALAESDFGMLMLSPDFFASDFIGDNELPHFIQPRGADHVEIIKPVVPVGLKPVPLDGSANLKGVEEIQIFRDDKARWFSQARGHTRDAFADQLTTALRIKLRGMQS